MSNISLITPGQKGILFFHATEQNIKNSEIELYATYDVLLRFPFPLDTLNKSAIKRLQNNIVLTEMELNIRNSLLREVPVSNSFIHAILAHFILNDKPVDYRGGNIKPVIKPASIPLREFVSSPSFEHIFFVLDCDMSSMSLLCIEVHPYKPITYLLAWLRLPQVSPAKWKGTEVVLDDLEELYSLTEEQFNLKLLEIESRKNIE